MKASKAKSHIGILKRICALVLCTAILIGIMPQVSFNKAEAANTTQTDALNKLVEWGIMRGDQAGNLSPQRAITRAEFVTMLNRTFGYTKTVSEPFKDVTSSNWFYDDIRIAYNAGYFTGTSKNTASPNANLTREAAVVMLCRNIMLKEQTGEDLSFTDSRLASDWSRGYIKAAAEKGIVTGDTSGTFRPLANITRGEVAILLARIIGTPVLNTGTYSNNVNGNLMINKSGITLDNMTVTGDLYITGGVGLGYVTLNNVHVYGQIIASGAGESNKGDCSIIIKNSSAPQMIVDSPSNQYVTIRTAGSTVIDKTYVRTDTYLEDKSNDGYGMKYIEVDGEEGTKLDLSGNINEVVSTTPKSAINVGSGVVKKLTIDENATNSTVKIDQGAVVETLNLDVATTVEGKGDIASLYVNAPGCKVEMLPDYIYIRPGITANINGTEMDSTLAQQMSDMPRILTGYPRSDDIAPTQITAKFETNKEGTVYWAVRLSGDGAMVADDIIKPPSYGAKIVKSGKVSAKEANTVIEAKISSLKLDTSYVLSAVLVDERGTNSLVKTLYFTTPDNSKPNFASGYPKTSLIEDTYVTFDVAASKNCTLYWAIYKKGMTAPIANDFKDNVLTGSIHSGTVKMTKSEEESVTMGNILETASNALKEYTDYDVYFFLSDGINDSTIKKVSVTTADRTPPEFLTNYPRISKIEAKKLTGEAAINEDGKIYWALVKHGTDYPVPDPNLDPNNPSDQEKLQLYYKNQIKGGMYALKSGSVSTTQDAIKSINFSGLTAETAYDIYFVAEDDHGNLSEIKVINNAKTLDSSAPELLEQKFSLANDKGVPLADTDITLVFDEDIYNQRNSKSLYEMFNETKDITTTILTTSDKKEFSLADLIKEMFVLRNLDISDSTQQVIEFNLGTTDFKDYIDVRLTEDGYTEVTFKAKALGLLSGTNYQFTLNQIKDSSNNLMPANTKVQDFTTLNAQVDLAETEIQTILQDDINGGQSVSIDRSFTVTPYAGSTKNANATSRYDIVIASDTTIKFNLYYREKKPTSDSSVSVYGDWIKCPNEFEINTTPNENWTATSWNKVMYGRDSTKYPYVVNFPDQYEFAIELTSINEISEPTLWNATVNLKIFCSSGSANNIQNNLVEGTITNSSYDGAVKRKEISTISNPTDFSITINRVNQSPPQFTATFPRVQAGDSVAKIQFELDRSGEVFYVVAPTDKLKPLPALSKPDESNDFAGANIGSSTTPDINASVVGSYNNWEYLSYVLGDQREHNLTSPTATNIINGKDNYSSTEGYRAGSKTFVEGSGTQSIEIDGLEPSSTYYVYFVLKGSYDKPSSVMVYQFKTGEVIPPLLTASNSGSSARYTISANTKQGQNTVDADVYWKLFTQVSGTGYPTVFDDKPLWIKGKKPTGKVYNTVIEVIKDDIFTSEYIQSEQLNEAWNEISSPDDGGYEENQRGEDKIIQADKNGKTNIIVDPDLLGIGDYILFIAAKNSLSGNPPSSPVFDVVTNIHRYSENGPMIEKITTYSNNRGSDDGELYHGTIQIKFDQPLYIRNNLNKTDPYIPKSEDLTPKNTSTYSADTPPTPTDVLIIDLNNIQVGKVINIFSTYTYTDKDGVQQTARSKFFSVNGKERQNDITLRMESILQEDGKYKWVAVINDGSEMYDGKISETNPELLP